MELPSYKTCNKIDIRKQASLDRIDSSKGYVKGNVQFIVAPINYMKNTLSDLYDKYMAKYTVEKPEYDADEDDEAMFEAIFGRDLEDEV